MSTNKKRAAWAEACLDLFADQTGTDTPEDSIGDLICNLGHYANREGLDFIQLVKNGLGHWHLEQIDEESLDQMPTVSITIQPCERNPRG